MGQPFGRLLTLDLYGCSKEACDDLTLCYDFLEALVTLLGMTKQSPPFLFRSPAEKYPDKAGLSGWVPLIESGVQVHTLVPKRFVSIDVYSCGEFSTENIVSLATKFFQCRETEMNLIDRGTKYHEVG